MNNFFIQYVLVKLNSKKNIRDVKTYMNETDSSFFEIVIDTLVDKGRNREQAVIEYNSFKLSYKKLLRRIICALFLLILSFIVLLFTNNSIPFFNEEKYYINDSIVHEFEKKNLLSKDTTKNNSSINAAFSK